jgi:predicted nucleotidyltransferase
MRTLNQENLNNVKRVAIGLGHLRERVVFVGGAVVDFLITDPASPKVRTSMDVDVIIEIASLTDYYSLREPLLSLGFKEDNTGQSSPLCRWNFDEIIVDIMPTDRNILGFSNKWYIDAIKNAKWKEIADSLSIRIITAPFFLMTKLMAFSERGNEDFVYSRDIEDIVAILDGRPEVINEIWNSDLELKNSLIKTFKAMLQEDDFIDSVHGHLPDKERYPTIITRVKAIASMTLVHQTLNKLKDGN